MSDQTLSQSRILRLQFLQVSWCGWAESKLGQALGYAAGEECWLRATLFRFLFFQKVPGKCANPKLYSLTKALDDMAACYNYFSSVKTFLLLWLRGQRFHVTMKTAFDWVTQGIIVRRKRYPLYKTKKKNVWWWEIMKIMMISTIWHPWARY